LPSTYARNDLLAVVEDDSRLVCELGPNLPVPCASEVEVFDFVSRLLRPVNPPVSMPTSPSSLLLTGGFQPDQLGYELHCVHAAKEVGLVGALLPPACRVVCPALTQGRLHHVMESHASIRVWVHTGHGNIENLVCADGLDLTRQQLTAARRKAPRLELVVLSACNSDKLGAALARAHVRFVVAYPRAVLPALAYHVSHPVVRAYFENLEKDGLEEAVCRAFFAGTDAQRGAGADHRPVLFVDGTRRPRAR
jgi:hypothetical protein